MSLSVIQKSTKILNMNTKNNLDSNTLGSWVKIELPNLLMQSGIRLGESWVDLSKSTPKLADSMIGWESNSVEIVEREIEILEESLGNSWIVIPTKKPEEKENKKEEDSFLVAREVKDLTHDKSNILIKLHLMATVMEGIVKGTVTVARNWDKIVCGLAGIAGGGAQMISFNPVNIGVGLVRVAASVKIMWDAYSRLTPEQIQEIVNDSKASVEAIGLLAKANEESLERVQKHLHEAQNRAAGIKKCLADVEVIQNHGSAAVNGLQNKAKESFELVQELLFHAQGKFEEADKISKGAREKFNDVIDSLNTMMLLFNAKGGTDEAKIEILAKLTQKIATNAQEAYEEMEKAQLLRDEGSELLEQVFGLQITAAQAYGEAVGVANIAMQKMAKKAQKAAVQNEEVVKNIDQAEEKIIKDIRPRNKDIEQMAKEIVEDLGVMQNIVSDYTGILRMLSCAVGAIVLNSIIGPIPSIILAIGVVKYAHSLANAMTNWLAKKVVVDSKVIKINEEISYEFDAKSSSMLKKLQRKVSQTTGNLTVRVGSGTLKMKFNLDNKRSSLSAQDLLKFSQAIKDAVEKKEISKKEALKIIEDLKTCTIERKGRNWMCREVTVMKQGFIAKDCSLLNELERGLGKQQILAVTDETEDSQYWDMRAGAVFLS